MNILSWATIGVLLNSGALYGVTYLLETVDYTGGWLFFVVTGTLMGILNTLVKPILKILSLPLAILTVGLSLIAINILIFWLADYILPFLRFPNVDLIVDGLTGYVLGGLLFGIINWIENLFISNK